MNMNIREIAGRVHTGVDPVQRGSPPGTIQRPQGDNRRFSEALERALGAKSDINVSAHAKQRIEQRGIHMEEADRKLLMEALQQLEGKGSQDALVLRSDAAFVVNVPSRTIVTAMDREELQSRIFTQIDSALVI